MQVLMDAQWAKFEAAIAATEIRGSPARKDERRTIEAIIWPIDNGAKWRAIPAELGHWHHAYLRFRQWTLAGVWDQIMVCLSANGATARVSRTGLRNPSRGEALGRSRGGFGTKIVGICEAAGRRLDFLLVPGQAHELAPSLALLKRLPEAPNWALADRACDAQAFRTAARDMGATPVVPSRKGAKSPQPCPAHIYRHRTLIERCWSRLKERRAVATRYDKTAAPYAATIAIAASLDWIKSCVR
jgi:transposase